MVISAFTGSVVIFVLLRSVGGDIATVMLGNRATQESLELLRETFGLNRSWVEQYVSWIGGVLTGNLGEAYSKQYVISTEIAQRLEPTLILTFGSLLISIPIALVIGLYSAMNFKRWRGASVDGIAQIGLAIPQFFLALVLVLIFAVRLGWLPATGYVSIFTDPVEALRSMVLPITTLSLGITAVFRPDGRFGIVQ
jgi:peptide/nickel transport system permease protein